MRVLILTLMAALHLPAAYDLSTVLANMDKAAASFQGFRGETEWASYTKLVDDTSVEKGVIAVRRGPNQRIELLVEFAQPYERDLLVRGTRVEIYKPKIATVEEYDLAKRKDQLQDALLSGFGVSGKFLQERYNVSLAGEEQAAGKPTVKLTLVPKAESTRNDIPKIDMWVSTETWQPVQQRLYQNNGDYRTYTYTNVVMNPALKDSDFELDLPKKVKRESKKM